MGLVLLTTIGSVLPGAEWPQFRGPDNTGFTKAEGLPIEWSEADAEWQIELTGRCVSGPIVVGSHVITTGSSGPQNERLHIWSVDDQTGRVEWQRNLWATGRTRCHPLTSMAAPTPASDGQHLYVLFSSNDLVCLDLEGSVLWMRALGQEYPQAFDDRGLGSSPLLIDQTLVLQVQCRGDSFAIGIDTQSGTTRWRRSLPPEITWLSPTMFRQGEVRSALVQTSEELLVLDPKTGSVKATYAPAGTSIASPVAADGHIFMPGGGMTGLKLEPRSSSPFVVWKEDRLAASSSSPVVGNGKLYVIRSPNILTCAEAATGRELWKFRLRGKRYWATPVLTTGHLYTVSAEGLVQVVSIGGEKPLLAATNDMHEEILGSPAVSDDALYLRGVTHLWKISTPR